MLGGKERECTLGEVGFVVMVVGRGVVGAGLRGGWAVGDGTNQGQGENPPPPQRDNWGGRETSIFHPPVTSDFAVLRN